MSEFRAVRTVVVTNPSGLHARAATAIADLVRRFRSKIVLAKNGLRVEGTDVLQVLTLGAHPGEQLVLEAVGDDAEAAVEALAQLFAAKFNEEQ